MCRILIFFLTLLVFGCKTNQENIPLVIAHRGTPYFAPEETAPAFLLARELGADYLEADLQRTKDGVIIALHDDNLKRTTNIEVIFPERANDPVSSFTWKELQELDAGSWFNEKYPNLARASFAGLKILSLEDLIVIAETGKREVGLYLETKLPQQFPGIEADLKKLLQKHGWLNKNLEDKRSALILQSFVPQSIELLRQEFPETPICYLLWQGAGCLVEFDKQHLIQCLTFADRMNIDLIGISFKGEKTGYFDQFESWFIQEVQSRGKKIHAYTFDTKQDIEKYGLLVDGQFTNRADLSLDFYARARPNVEDIFLSLGY